MTSAFAPTATPDVRVVTETLYLQLMSVMGLKKPNWITRLLFPVFKNPTQYMATLLVELDENIARLGWNRAAKQFTSHFVSDVEIRGAEMVPKSGPLMVVGNHPAAYDIAILAAAIERDDLKIIASDVAFVQLLPNVRPHSIPVPYNIPQRLGTVRGAIQHLREGGAIFIFPRGNVEPDPTVSPGAVESLSGWSPSIELFLRMVPETKTVLAISSGMLSKKWYRNPLIQLWRKYEQRQKVAEIFQVAAQIITRRKPGIKPRISFSGAYAVDELGGLEAPQGALLANIVQLAKLQLENHLEG